MCDIDTKNPTKTYFLKKKRNYQLNYILNNFISMLLSFQKLTESTLPGFLKKLSNVTVN